ncbi:MAG: hypothetical protein WED11_01035 [Natronospirillum sp.]
MKTHLINLMQTLDVCNRLEMAIWTRFFAQPAPVVIHIVTSTLYVLLMALPVAGFEQMDRLHAVLE